MRSCVLKIIIVAAILYSAIMAVIFFTRSEKSISRLAAGISLADSYRACANQAIPRQEQGTCLKELAGEAGNSLSASEIDAVIGSLTKPEELSWCHEFMHYAGWGLYKKTKNISEAFMNAGSKCDSGMFHGIVEEYISEASEGKDPEQFVTSVASTACEGDVAKNSLLHGVKAICYHGLGHAFMFITGNNLPQSLRHCDALAQPGNCYTGAFMENLQSKQVGRLGTHPSAYMPKPGDPDYPCNLLDEKHRDFCYRYTGIAMVVQTKGDFKKAFEYCLNVAPPYKNICFFGVGTDVPSPQWTSYEAGKKCKLALEVSKNAYAQCIKGAMAFLIQLNLGDPQAVNEFCRAIESDYHDLCFESAGANFRSWVGSNKELAEKCNKLSNMRGREICLNQNLIGG